MAREEHQAARAGRAAASSSRATARKVTVSGFTQLGLVEMTRKRTRESLAHMLCEPCPTCAGRGEVKTARSVCYDILREILREARQFNPKEFRVIASGGGGRDAARRGERSTWPACRTSSASRSRCSAEPYDRTRSSTTSSCFEQGAAMFTRWRHPIHALPFDEPISNALAEEFESQRLGRRVQALRKAALRELVLFANGQSRRRVERVPEGVRRMLWVYTWTTVGDAIMDLAPRILVPRHVSIDLLIAPALAPLFATDRRLRKLHSHPSTLADDIDFVLLDSFRTTSLRLKAKRYPALAFASMRGHNAGERFDRVAFADRRIRQLFGLAAGDVVQPRLDLGETGGAVLDEARFRIAVPLGARVARKRYAHWGEALAKIVAGWPQGMAPPLFELLGQGESARKDLKALAADFVAAHALSRIDSGDLRKSALDIAACDAFLGVDGGLMHVAVAVGTPGLALFADIEPGYFLRPGSTMEALRSDGEVSDLAPAPLAAAFLAALPRLLKARRSADA